MPRKLVSCFVAMFMAVALSTAGARAQDGPENSSAKPAAAKKERAKSRGRLPNHYRNVVTKEQREQIYALQRKYQAEIKQLQDQLAAIKKKLAEETEALLSPEQRAKVAKLIEEAKAASKKRADEERAAAKKARDATE